MYARAKVSAVAAMALTTVLLVACGSKLGAPVPTHADNPYPDFYQKLQGRRVGFVPIAMGFDLTDAWLAGMQRQASELGYQIIVRDPNWSIETGIQAINSLIAEKPDVLIVQNNDGRSYRRAIQHAMSLGIPVIQVQQRVDAASNYFVGPDFFEIGALSAKAMVTHCSDPGAPSRKIALLQGSLNAPASIDALNGILSVLRLHKEMRVVSSQATEWDATKSYQITSTVLKQHADLCGIIGFWDVSDVGTAGAIREAGLQGKVALITSGGGNQQAACDKIRSGDFTFYYSYNVPGQARDLNTAIKTLLQAKAGAQLPSVVLLNPLIEISRETMTPASCWTIGQLQKTGG